MNRCRALQILERMVYLHETVPDKGTVKRIVTESQIKVTGWGADVARHGSHGSHGIHGAHGMHGVHGSHGGRGVHGSHGGRGVQSSGAGPVRDSEL